MFDSATLNLFAAITIFVVATVKGRDLIAGRRLGGFVLTTAMAQSISGLAGIGLAILYLLAVG
ncbi:hypothetical protein J5Y09_04335 [Roseomonas sp. PWR1]|uniref:Uncharacterized protein n=1 Tax=Roseomonas nitratireducens TaxID=2820810 RepID=A0ABS4AP39_9PROT|nr:hypothetical protein [Neoroseomonas nitratireducens]MBP0463129.1 hypothetical protein [Neoroseomonas nitratireducens]